MPDVWQIKGINKNSNVLAPARTENTSFTKMWRQSYPCFTECTLECRSKLQPIMRIQCLRTGERILKTM